MSLSIIPHTVICNWNVINMDFPDGVPLLSLSDKYIKICFSYINKQANDTSFLDCHENAWNCMQALCLTQEARDLCLIREAFKLFLTIPQCRCCLWGDTSCPGIWVLSSVMIFWINQLSIFICQTAPTILTSVLWPLSSKEYKVVCPRVGLTNISPAHKPVIWE